MPVNGCVASPAMSEHASPAPPATIVVFGASGDLTRRKLMPALYSLECQRLLDPGTRIIGVALTEWSDDQFRATMRSAVADSSGGHLDPREWAAFAGRIHYLSMGFDEPAGYGRLHDLLREIESAAEPGSEPGRLFYLATAPAFFPVIARHLGESHVSGQRAGERFRRLIVEKPFGRDLASARDLNESLHEHLREEQLYRIDHYLGKETVQNILALRLGNAIFEPLWNARHIDHVQITMAEEIGVVGRGGYYDAAGALTDMVQNHLLQVLSVVAMEPPARFDARRVRDEKVKVLDAIRPLGPGSGSWAARGQYHGYLEEQGVATESATETFCALRLEIENWRWAGTPFYLRTGKCLPRRATEIAIQFRPAPHSAFDRGSAQPGEPNMLVLQIQPEEGAYLRFAAKAPGPAMDLRPVEMHMDYGSSFVRKSSDAYERLLLDALLGDATLFARQDEVERAWEIVQPLLEAWRSDPVGVKGYEPGTWGPAEAERLIGLDGRRWHQG